MIRINLLKQPVKKKVARKSISPKLLMISGVTTGVLIILGGGFWVVKYFDLFAPKQARTEVARDDVSPTTFSNSQTVEDVVSDIDDDTDKLKRRGTLDLPYEQLSAIEKINYEIQYAKNICDLLGRSAIPGVDFNTITMQSFNQFKGIGRSSSKESVIQLFRAMKNEKIDLLPQPMTQISKSDEGFRFTIACKTRFGLNLEAPFLIGPNEISAYSDLEDVLAKIKDCAENDRISMTSGLSREDAFVDGIYRTFKYRMNGTASYNGFVSFVINLYNRQVPCAIETLKITAQSNTRIKIDAIIKITTAL